MSGALTKKLDPKIETVALVWQFAGTDCDDLHDGCSFEAVVGDPSVKSPRLKEDPAMFHGATVVLLQRHNSLRVVPYTIDDEATMQGVMVLGVRRDH